MLSDGGVSAYALPRVVFSGTAATDDRPVPDPRDGDAPLLAADGSLRVAVWAPDQAGLSLCLPDEQRPDDADRERQVALDPGGDGWWRGTAGEVRPGDRYGLRVNSASSGQRRQSSGELLLDPYARAVTAAGPGGRPCAVVPDPGDDAGPTGFDWAGDRRPELARDQVVIDELHVRGYTRLHPAVPEHQRGTYAGLAHPAVLDHLVSLGITAVELLPVHQFATEPRLTQLGLSNFWGYNSLAFFAPHGGYSSVGDRGGQVAEFKAMVAAMHEAGLQVLLDVVYNHTAEQGADGVTSSLRGLADRTSYRRDSSGGYLDVTGCGNTVDLSHPATLALVLDSLRYWVAQMHVDGFRFDLAPALCRAPVERGNGFDTYSPFLAAVGQDPLLRHTVLIAEPWDIGDRGYVLGGFPAGWAEWNDRFRDTVRDFWRGGLPGGAGPLPAPERRNARRSKVTELRHREPDAPAHDHSRVLRELASRLTGSGEVFAGSGRPPLSSVNFVTAHDGMTLTDLVSYDHKHNDANGEHNRDGTGEDHSANHGVEGPTDDPNVLALRARQRRNLVATVLLAVGTPMLVGADELDRTQRGNNNAYCHDDPTTWVDWSALRAGPDINLSGWVRRLLNLRAEHACLRPTTWDGPSGATATRWVSGDGTPMDVDAWHDPRAQTLGMLRPASGGGSTVLVLFHAGSQHRDVRLPPAAGVGSAGWRLVADSAYPVTASPELLAAGATLSMTARSLVVLVQHPGAEGP